jgi:[NiFe] hydrogenase assembly HybE family chaperone
MHSAVDRLVADYRDIVQPRMNSLPMYNPALTMEAIGFRPHDGRFCGILLAPWFMNLVALPGESDEWSGLVPGKTFKMVFPGGEYELMLSLPDGLTPHLILPLFTTVLDFADQDTANQVAEEILHRLFEVPEDTDSSEGKHPSLFDRRLSRRNLLRGLLTLEKGKPDA